VLKQRILNRTWLHSQRKSLMVHSQQILGAGHAVREHGLHSALTILYNRPIGMDPSGIPIDATNVSRMAEWLRGPNAPTAIIGDDFRMLGVRLAAIQAGLKIPDDLLMIGVGGTFLAHAGEMPTVSLRYDLVAEQVGRILLADPSEFGGTAQHIVVPPMLLERRTTEQM
jgi:DNA-binding LacI/PurR family transcriptional regulator